MDEAFRLVSLGQKQVSSPEWIDLLKIVLLCLLIPLALALPFLPFLWLNRQSRKASEKWAWQAQQDPGEILRGSFTLVNGYLDACGVGEANALYVHRMNGCAGVPEDYAALYRSCAEAWQRAVYGDRPVTDDERDQALRLLNMTLTRWYDQATLRDRLRLKYVCCLHD